MFICFHSSIHHAYLMISCDSKLELATMVSIFKQTHSLIINWNQIKLHFNIHSTHMMLYLYLFNIQDNIVLMVFLCLSFREYLIIYGQINI